MEAPQTSIIDIMEKEPNMTQLNIKNNYGPIFGGKSIFKGTPPHSEEKEDYAEEVPFEVVKEEAPSQPSATVTTEAPKHELTYSEKEARLKKAILSVLPFINVDRKWFAVCKGIMKLQLVGNGDFDAALSLIKAAFPKEKEPKIKAHDIQKLDAMTLARDATQWDKSDSPVGKLTPEYQTVYYKFMANFE